MGNVVFPVLSALILAACALSSANAGDAPISVTQCDDLGGGLKWSGWHLDNTVAQAAVAPQLGGRLISYRLGGQEFCWTDPEWHGRRMGTALGGDSFWQYAAYGGARFLLAPQALWKVAGAPIPAWPPAPTIDRGDYSAVPTATGVECKGPAEDNPVWACSGMALRYLWQLTPGSSCVSVDTVATNYSQFRQTWGLWCIMQALIDEPRSGTAAAVVLWPQRKEGRSRFGDGETLDVTGLGRDGITHANGLITVAVGIPRKVSGDSDGGWIVLYRPAIGMALGMSFPYDAEAWTRMAYPEGGSTVAVSPLSPAPAVELENMGPVCNIPPGASISLHQTIAGCAIAAAPQKVEDWGMVAVAPAVDGGRLHGSLGVFDHGDIRVEAAGKLVTTFPVSPLHAVILDVDVKELHGLTLSLVKASGSVVVIAISGG